VPTGSTRVTLGNIFRNSKRTKRRDNGAEKGSIARGNAKSKPRYKTSRFRILFSALRNYDIHGSCFLSSPRDSGHGAVNSRCSNSGDPDSICITTSSYANYGGTSDPGVPGASTCHEPNLPDNHRNPSSLSHSSSAYNSLSSTTS
jgi:hypothetical protein